MFSLGNATVRATVRAVEAEEIQSLRAPRGASTLRLNSWMLVRQQQRSIWPLNARVKYGVASSNNMHYMIVTVEPAASRPAYIPR